ncbi:MAG: hypothetical protein WCS94_08180 [Verrucomicrobiota bacterium]
MNQMFIFTEPFPKSIEVHIPFPQVRGRNYGKLKGRELNAPFFEAPRSAHTRDTPSRADGRVPGLILAF